MPIGIYIRDDAWRKMRSQSQKRMWNNLEYKNKMSLAHLGKISCSGEDSHFWLGGNPKPRVIHNYSGIHQWVRRHFGRPDRCSSCGKDNLYGRKIHWANVDGEYTKEKNNWIRLCVPCHYKFGHRKIYKK